MRSWTRGFVVVFTFLAAAALMAQGSGVPGKSSFDVSKSLMGKIVEVRLEDKIVVIELEDGKRYAFLIQQKTKLKADKKTTLAAKKKLELTDFEKDQPVKITYRPDKPQEAMELRLRRVKS